MIIPVQRVGQYGLVTDLPYDEIPLNAWTAGRNVRFRAGAVEKFSGHTPGLGTPLISPEWLFYSGLTGTPLWAYANSTNFAATDGSTHADITRTSGPYTTLPGVPWTGGVVEGIPVFNNGQDIPQMWTPPALSTKLQDLANWPANLKVRTLRSFKRYLIGFDVIKDVTRSPTMIKWSHQAPTGGVPLSWDETDETIDAGEWVLPTEEGGIIIDMIPMRDVGIIYRENETWQMAETGASNIFRFTRLFKHVGIISRLCAAEFFSGKQVAFTGDDVVLLDGPSAKSILDTRFRSAINLDLKNYHRSFVAVDYASTEVLVCFPEPGQEWASKALVWNWVVDTWGVRDLPNVGPITPGVVVEGSSSNKWNDAVGKWDSFTTAWGDRKSDPTKRKLVMPSPVTNLLYVNGVTQQFADENMRCFVERRDLGFPLKHPSPPDFTRKKQVTSLWPKISGSQGGAVNVYLGTQQTVNGPVTWGPARAFVIGTDDMLDFSDLEASRLHALRIESESNLSWKLSGYDVDVIDRGMY